MKAGTNKKKGGVGFTFDTSFLPRLVYFFTGDPEAIEIAALKLGEARAKKELAEVGGVPGAAVCGRHGVEPLYVCFQFGESRHALQVTH